MRESAIEKKICDYAKSRGCITFKFVSPGHSSVPDRLIIAPHGRILFMEIKATNKKPTELQMREMKSLADRNVPVTWTDSVEGGKARVDMLLLKPA